VKYGNWPKCGRKQGDSVRIYMRSDAMPARGEESSGSSFIQVVAFAEDVPRLDIRMQALREVRQVTVA